MASFGLYHIRAPKPELRSPKILPSRPSPVALRAELADLLHLGLGGRASVDSSVVIDEGQVLALFGGIGFLHLHPYNEATPSSCFKQGSANELPMGWQ